jgi:hypothetical protein
MAEVVGSGNRGDFALRRGLGSDQPTAQTGDIFASDRFGAITCSRPSSPGVADSRSPQSVAGD